MKTVTFLIPFLFGISSVKAQEGHQPGNTPNIQFSTDQVIQNKASEDQRNLRMASAYNGWLYAAYTINNTTTGVGGIYVSVSKDNGESWKKFVTYQFGSSFYSLTDVVIGGRDSTHLNVFIAGVLQNTANNTSTLYIDDFDGRTGSLLAGQVYHRSLGSLTVTDLSMACDYLFPAHGSAPFGVGLLYTLHGGASDSLLFTSSQNGGQTFAAVKPISTTQSFYRKISLAYGRSPSVIGGAYFAAWELLGSSVANAGHIYTAHCSSLNQTSWINPVCIDSLDANAVNQSCHPSISVQQSNSDNDQLDLSAMIVFESMPGGNQQNKNISCVFNKGAYSNGGWISFPVISTAENDMQPFTAFNPFTNLFMLTYLDSTDGKLPLLTQDMNLGKPGSWSTVTTQYNDQTSQLGAANPRIAVNIWLQQPTFIWITELPGTSHGVAMFDAAYSGLATGIVSGATNTFMLGTPFPNPSSGSIQIPITNDHSQPVWMEVYDMLGNTVREKQETELTPGNQLLTVDASKWNTGVYFCRLTTNEHSQTYRLVVQH